MDKKIHKNPIGWIKFWTPKDDWYFISSEERERYFSDYEKLVSRILENNEVRKLGTYKCRGQSEWFRFELWEFPDILKIIEFTQALEEIGHFQYFEEDNTIGRKYERNNDLNGWIV